jgi:hypothetical protein
MLGLQNDVLQNHDGKEAWVVMVPLFWVQTI